MTRRSLFPAGRSRLSLLDYVSKANARIRARGAREVADELAGRVRDWVRSDHELKFLVRPALWEGRSELRSDEPLEMARATARDGPDYQRFVGTDSARTFAKRLTSETSCWLVRGRGIVLHATWTGTGATWTREIRRYFVPPGGGAYIYESFTRPEARGLGIYPFALVEIGRALASEGVDTLFVGVEADNAASLRAITKAGFEEAFSSSFHRSWGRLEMGQPSGPLTHLARDCLVASENISRGG